MLPSKSLRPADLDDMARAEGATIGAIRRLIPKECHEIIPARSWGGLAMAFGRLAVALLVLTRLDLIWGPSLLWQVPALLAAWLFAGFCYTGLFVIGHDCAHMAFSRRRWVNELVGHICLSPELTGFHNWRIWHNHHHAKTQLRGDDPDWPERMMTRAEYDRAPLGLKAHVRLGFGTPLGILVGFWTGMARRTFMRAAAPQIPLTRAASRELLFSSAMMVMCAGGISWFLIHTGGVWAAVKYYYVPTFIAAAHGAMLTYLHHTSADGLVFDEEGWTPFRGQVVSTFNVRFPRWIERMWFDINIHLPHHLAPKIPWYHLLPALEAIRAARPDWVLERRFSLAYLRAAWARPLLVRSAGGDRFEMGPFEAEAAEATRDSGESGGAGAGGGDEEQERAA